MRISEVVAAGDRFSAEFCFERRDLGAFTGFIDSPAVVAEPAAFLLAAWLPSWALGETRITIEGPVCPVLLANLQVAGGVLKGWFRDFPPLPRIECDMQSRPPSGRRAAFLSGGVDSLSMIRELAGGIDTAILLDYQSIEGVEAEETEARFRQRVEICRAISDGIGLELWPVRTNLRRLNSSMGFWMHRWHGSFLAAMAHGLDVQEVSIASTYDATNLERWGSHPLLDPYYSSARLNVRHYGLHQSRLDKVRSLADWPLALDLMYVCTSRESGGSNCGKCEKCIRTRLELTVLGLKSSAFPPGDVTLEELQKIDIASNYAWSCYNDILPLLRSQGRDDLAAALMKKKPPAPSALSRGMKYATDVLRSRLAGWRSAAFD